MNGCNAVPFRTKTLHFFDEFLKTMEYSTFSYMSGKYSTSACNRVHLNSKMWVKEKVNAFLGRRERENIRANQTYEDIDISTFRDTEAGLDTYSTTPISGYNLYLCRFTEADRSAVF